MPVIRGLWLHYSEDPLAVARGDEYLWGRDVLVAPVADQGATSRRVYLPKGAWYDFWTGERVEGGREIARPIDLETIPLYVRAGGLLPLGPVKQYVTEKVDEPVSITVYPGADGQFQLYEDDGLSFNHRRGEWMGIDMSWNDARRALSLKLADGSRMLPPLTRPIKVKLEGQQREVSFNGRPIEVSF
jgi:alpha-glucosidase/alpha-D-xyloside xylohydrolase